MQNFSTLDPRLYDLYKTWLVTAVRNLWSGQAM